MSTTDRRALAATYRRYRGHPTAGGKWCPDNAGNAAIADERRSAFGDLLGPLRPSIRRLPVLEIGSGQGDTRLQVASLLDEPGALVAVDLLGWHLPPLVAAGPLAPVCAACETLPFRSATFGLVILSTLVSSILDRDVARRVGREVSRVLDPAGAVLWYDLALPNPANRGVRAVGRRELGRLLRGFTLLSRRVTVLPPLARRLGRFTTAAYPVLARVPPLRSHRVALLTPRP